MKRYICLSTVLESCHPYHKLIEGINARKSIGICKETADGYKTSLRDSCNFEELDLAPPINL